MAQSKSQPKQKTEVVATKREPKKQITTKHEELKPIVPPVETKKQESTETEWDAKMFIYYHESGNNPKRWNSSGCVGLGQACPASKLLAVCPTMDYACEDTWFTQYMKARYETWNNAKAFWLAHHWW